MLTEEDRLKDTVLRTADVAEVEANEQSDTRYRDDETDHSERNEHAGAAVPKPEGGE
jgi:hypothetical protein